MTNGTPPGKSRDDLFDRIEEQDAADEAGRVLALSDAELDRELAAGGFDPAAVRARGLALGQELMRKARRARLRRGAAIAAAALVVVAVVVVLALWLGKPRRPVVPADRRVPSGQDDQGVAHLPPTPEEMRKKALAACDAGRWAQCLAGLDEARERDPKGDGAAEVHAARERAKAATEAGD